MNAELFISIVAVKSERRGRDREVARYQRDPDFLVPPPFERKPSFQPKLIILNY